MIAGVHLDGLDGAAWDDSLLADGAWGVVAESLQEGVPWLALDAELTFCGLDVAVELAGV